MSVRPNGWIDMDLMDFNIDDFEMEEFPFHGAFYTYETNEDLPLDEREPKEVLVFSTECDIQKRSGLRQNTALLAEYTVYFPLTLDPDSTGAHDKYGPVKVRRGMKFRGTGYGYTYEGTVEMVRFSQLGGCSVDIRVETESDL